MKNLKPLFIENSKIPVWLSKIAPIDIGAICLGPFVISRGAISERLRVHETIHFQQYLETGFIGFLLIYAYDYLKCMIKYRDGAIAYRHLRAEQESYENENDHLYLQRRKRWEWLTKYKM